MNRLPRERELPEDRLAYLKESLMSQIATEAGNPGSVVDKPRRSRAALAGVGVLVGALALGAGAVAVADGIGVWRSDGMVHIEVQNLDVIYNADRISQDALQALNDEGKGLFTATDVDTATDLNATRAFDTQAELDAYTSAYTAWQKDKLSGSSVKPWGVVAPVGWTAPAP